MIIYHCHDDDEDLGPARGVIVGTLLSAAIWVSILALLRLAGVL